MDAQQKRITELVKKHAAEIAEHVDSVRIFVTARNESESDHWITYSSGHGNIYAQEGQVSEWIYRQRERARMDEEKQDEEPTGD